jgi:hypothetical protein
MQDSQDKPDLWRRSVLQIAELKEKEGILTVDRNAPVRVRLKP